MQTVMTLSQKGAIKFPKLEDYACNVYADALAAIDINIINSTDLKLIEELRTLRSELLIIGRALWIKRSDPLSNLGFLVGRTGTDEPRSGIRAILDATT